MDTSWPPWVPTSPGASSPHRSTRSRSKSPISTSKVSMEEAQHLQDIRKLELLRHDADMESKRLREVSVKLASEHQRNKDLIRAGSTVDSQVTLTGDWNEVWDGSGETEIVGCLSIWQDGNVVHGTHEAAEGAGPSEICTIKGKLHDEIVTWLFIDWETEFTGTLSRDATILSGICRKKIDSDEWNIRFVRKSAMKKSVSATVKSPPRSPRLTGVKSRYRDQSQQKVPISRSGSTTPQATVRTSSPGIKKVVKTPTKPTAKGSQKLKAMLRESSLGAVPKRTSTATTAFGRTTSPIRRTASPSARRGPSEGRTPAPVVRVPRTSSPAASQLRSTSQQSRIQKRTPSRPHVRVVNVADGTTSGGSGAMPIFTGGGGPTSGSGISQRDASVSVISSAINASNRTYSPGRKAGQRSGTPRDRIASGSPAASTVSRLSGIQTRATTSAIPTELDENEVLQLHYLRAAVATKRLRHSKKQQLEQVTKQHRMLSALTASLNSEAAEQELEQETALSKSKIANSARELHVPVRSEQIMSDTVRAHQQIVAGISNSSSTVEMNNIYVSSLRSLHETLLSAKELLGSISSVSSDSPEVLLDTLNQIDDISTDSAQYLSILFDFIHNRSLFHKILSLKADLNQRLYITSFCSDP